MKIADILRTLANNLDHPEGGTPDPRIQNPAELIDVATVTEPEQTSPNGTTASGNDKDPEDLFLPPLQQKQELLKKAVGVENVYDDGRPGDEDTDSDADTSSPEEDLLQQIKRIAGIPTAAIQELSNDEVFDD